MAPIFLTQTCKHRAPNPPSDSLCCRKAFPPLARNVHRMRAAIPGIAPAFGETKAFQVVNYQHDDGLVERQKLDNAHLT